MFMVLMGTVVIAGIVGYLSEKTGFTHNGYLPSIIICVGGAFFVLLCAYHVRYQFWSPRSGRRAVIHRRADHRADPLEEVICRSSR